MTTLISKLKIFIKKYFHIDPTTLPHTNITMMKLVIMQMSVGLKSVLKKKERKKNPLEK